ncbi:hypothetical protein Rsub_04005 [Raphidocelis subcapitata]|uniref:Tyrosine-protein kinase ephrin type A/B receptor-like domain-containing protein n=1 Tax=Raphidocelis subcapitata TaxID=307507 RepID=A0A2V0NVP3_9CHLO|nr:hypothetical protein Rsub_04005 [Raphidocelis subcapitata]|eukprot:GBF91701.1 hypothetical protein Rsub_04005 [Raphidocelis subcapitata]
MMSLVRLSALALLALIVLGAPAAAQSVPRPSVARPTAPAAASAVADRTSNLPNYKPTNLTALTETWQRAFSQAQKNNNGLASEGTWTINDMVKALQGSITQLGGLNDTALAGVASNATGSSADDADKRPSFDQFAGNLLCNNGLKLANCSGVNPCHGKKCFPGTMCMVNMCGSCSAKCVSYAEIGAGLNKVLNSVGLSGVKADVPTPNLPFVDKIVKSAKGIKQSLLPKCTANTVLDTQALTCKACAPGAVAAPGATSCTVCGRGKFADLKSSTCKTCNPGFYSAAATGNRFCVACPAETFAALAGTGWCAPCPAGTSTKGMKGQSRCARSRS